MDHPSYREISAKRFMENWKILFQTQTGLGRLQRNGNKFRQSTEQFRETVDKWKQIILSTEQFSGLQESGIKFKWRTEPFRETSEQLRETVRGMEKNETEN